MRPRDTLNGSTLGMCESVISLGAGDDQKLMISLVVVFPVYSSAT